jgi:ASC-1-like (ASCH) protein
MHLQKVPYSLIKNGTKTIEGRLAKDKYLSFKIGDIITFSNDKGSEIKKKIINIYKFPTFKEAFKKINYQEAVPNVNSTQEAINLYYSFYSIQEQLKYGVILFKIEDI